jgi:hypothetical protein
MHLDYNPIEPHNRVYGLQWPSLPGKSLVNDRIGDLGYQFLRKRKLFSSCLRPSPLRKKQRRRFTDDLRNRPTNNLKDILL